MWIVLMEGERLLDFVQNAASITTTMHHIISELFEPIITFAC